MKYAVMITLLICTCCSNPKSNENILEYFKWDENKLREYICRPTDSTMKRIFVSQNIKHLANEATDLEYVMKTVDAVPMNKGIERYYPDNQIELISQSLFELDSQDKPVEIKAQIIKGGRKSIADTSIDYELLYKFKVDSACTLHLNVRLTFNLQFIDSLKLECLFVTSREKLFLNFNDSRHDTTLLGESSRLYAKGKGLLYFEIGNTREKEIYRLKQE